MKSMFYILIAISLSGNIWAQKKCSDKFQEIDIECIRTYENKLKNFKLEVPAQQSSRESILYNTYFYKTNKGYFGKLRILSLLRTNKECSVFFEATTYINGTSHSPTTNLVISNDFNSWSTDSLGLGKINSGDLRLQMNTKGKCELVSTDAKFHFYKNTKETSSLEGNILLYSASLFLIGLAVYLVASSVFTDEEKYKAQERLEEADEDEEKRESNDLVIKYSRPFFKRYFSPIVKGMKNKKKIREKYKKRLANSGLSKELSPEDFFAFKLFLIIGFPIVFLGLREFLEESWPLTLVPVVSVLGFIYPDIWIKGKIQQRKEQVTAAMPFIVDMLALSVEAGLDFVAAMQKVIDKAKPSPLVEEFETLIKETKIGASRAEALRSLSWRVDTIQVSSFCATLIAADSVGANIAPILKTLSGEMRQKRSADAEKKGATAATKILFPMMFLILPAVGLIIMGPIILELMMGGSI